MRVIFCGVDGVLHPWNAASVAFGEVPQRLFEWTNIRSCLLARLRVRSSCRPDWSRAMWCAACQDQLAAWIKAPAKAAEQSISVSATRHLGTNPSDCRAKAPTPGSSP